jgi:hypothetical protein
MSKRASNKGRGKPKEPESQNKKVKLPLFGAILAVGTLLGYVVLIPRMTVVVSDPPDPNDPFSSSITVTNTGNLPLYSVSANLSIGTITFLNTQGNPITLKSEEVKTSYLVKDWPPHDLSLDDRFTVSLNDVLSGNRGSLVSAQIAVVVKYKLPLIHIEMEKRFPVFSKRTSNGNFYWYADTPKTN